jgi:hypothetical protein
MRGDMPFGWDLKRSLQLADVLELQRWQAIRRQFAALQNSLRSQGWNETVSLRDSPTRLAKKRSDKGFLPLPAQRPLWPAPGSEDTELGVLMELEVGHGETEVYPRVQA